MEREFPRVADVYKNAAGCIHVVSKHLRLKDSPVRGGRQLGRWSCGDLWPSRCASSFCPFSLRVASISFALTSLTLTLSPGGPKGHRSQSTMRYQTLGSTPIVLTMELFRRIPKSFALEACFDGHALWLRNDLSVPVHFVVSGDTGAVTSVHLDQGLAAVATRARYHDPLLLLPQDLVRIAIGPGAARLLLADTNAGGFYALATTVFTFLPAGVVKSAYDALTGMIAELSDDFAKNAACRTKHKRVVCTVILDRDVAVAVGRAALGGLAKGLLNVVLSAATFAKWADGQPKAIKKILGSQRTLSFTAAVGRGSRFMVVDAPSYRTRFQIGPLDSAEHHEPSLQDAIAAFGAPSVCANVAEDVRWPSLGITGNFTTLGGFPPGVPQNGCLSPKWVQPDHYILVGRWKTPLGLKIGDTVARLMELYPSAQRHGFRAGAGARGTGYWLTRRATPWNGPNAYFGRLIAMTRAGRVSGFYVSLQAEGE